MHACVRVNAYVRVRIRMRVRVRAPGRVKDRDTTVLRALVEFSHGLHSLDLDALGFVLQGFVWLLDLMVTP